MAQPVQRNLAKAALPLHTHHCSHLDLCRWHTVNNLVQETCASFWYKKLASVTVL